MRRPNQWRSRRVRGIRRWVRGIRRWVQPCRDVSGTNGEEVPSGRHRRPDGVHVVSPVRIHLLPRHQTGGRVRSEGVQVQGLDPRLHVAYGLAIHLGAARVGHAVVEQDVCRPIQRHSITPGLIGSPRKHPELSVGVAVEEVVVRVGVAEATGVAVPVGDVPLDGPLGVISMRSANGQTCSDQAPATVHGRDQRSRSARSVRCPRRPRTLRPPPGARRRRVLALVQVLRRGETGGNATSSRRLDVEIEPVVLAVHADEGVARPRRRHADRSEGA